MSVETLSIPRLLIAGTHSGVGKTTFVVGLIRALRARGLKVSVFKCGPDYLDPTYHARAADSPSHNLDGWMMGREAVLGTFARASANSDISIIEGVMGLFDGASPRGDEGSTAEIAKWLQAPVILVVDASGMARSVAALAHGFSGFDPDVWLAGLICNRVGGKGHLQLIREAFDSPPVFGGLPNNAAASFPERHLGLLSAGEDTVPSKLLSAWGEMVGDYCDVEAIVSLANQACPLTQPSVTTVQRQPIKSRIGLAFDEAFHFYYEDNLRQLESAGAELVRFSPIHDEHLPSVDGLYIGGGYPEVHAPELAANSSMRDDILNFAQAGRVIYAECGGLMYLCSKLRTLDDRTYAMCGVIAAQTSMCNRLQALGYVEVETVRDSMLGRAGERFRGHQFRYSNIEIGEGEAARAFSMSRRRDAESLQEGYQIRNTLGSYVHAHWASNPSIPAALVEACSREANRTVFATDINPKVQ